MTLFIDGDAFVNLLKPIVFKAVQKRRIPTKVVANKKITIGKSECIEYIIVDQGADEADHRIAELARAGDLVITADIPLADRIITKDAHAIDHRGELYSKDNIKQYLAVRNLMEQIRESGEMTKGPPAFTPKDARAFADSFNAFLQRRLG